MANLREPLCSWDTTIDERYNLYTTGNTEEVLPGITRPLPADLIRAWNYAWHTNATSQLQIEDLVPIPEPPGPTMLPIVAGQFLVNIGMVNAFTSTFETGGSADYLKQFFEGDEEITAEVSEDTSRAEEVQERLMAFLVRTRELIEADAQRARAHYAATLARDWTAVDDAGLPGGSRRDDRPQRRRFLHPLPGHERRRPPDHAPWRPPRCARARPSRGVDGGTHERPHRRRERPPFEGHLGPQPLRRRPPRPRDRGRRYLRGRFPGPPRLPPDGDWATFAGEYEAFIADLGFRGQRETDPSCLTWNEAPQFVLSSLQADLAAGDDRNPHVLEERSAAQRVALEAEVEAALPEDQHAEFRRLLELSQILNGGRESTKANWTRFCRTYRPPIVEMGRRLAERGDIDNPEDVWFLRLEELPEALDGGLSAAELQDSIVERRHEYEALHDYVLPVLFERPVEASRRQAAEASGETAFQGIGVSPGQARGRARVILSADAGAEATLLPGEILVAPVTDAPWTPLFLPAAGVVVETGGVLSHAATVAREYGIPAVTGIRGATELIPNGTMLSINGATGAVTIEEG